jgi:hypothetical protein
MAEGRDAEPDFRRSEDRSRRRPRTRSQAAASPRYRHPKRHTMNAGDGRLWISLGEGAQHRWPGLRASARLSSTLKLARRALIQVQVSAGREAFAPASEDDDPHRVVAVEFALQAAVRSAIDQRVRQRRCGRPGRFIHIVATWGPHVSKFERLDTWGELTSGR